MPGPNMEQKQKLLEGLVSAGNVIRRTVKEGPESSEQESSGLESSRKDKKRFKIDLEKVKNGRNT